MFMGFGSLVLEFVGAQQGHKHVAGDGDRAGAIEQGDEHAQTRLRRTA
jgi:hypothetical protein